MKNQFQPGHTTDVAAPYAVTSGSGCLVGSLFGIAAYDAAISANVTLYHVGSYAVAKVSAQAWAVGALIYWDDTAKLFTTVSTSNKIVGVAVKAASNPSPTGVVRLNGAALS